MEDEEGAGIAVLLHEILSFEDFAEFEFFQEHFLELGILDEGGESKMALESFEDDCLIVRCFLLIDL